MLWILLTGYKGGCPIMSLFGASCVNTMMSLPLIYLCIVLLPRASSTLSWKSLGGF